MYNFYIRSHFCVFAVFWLLFFSCNKENNIVQVRQDENSYAREFFDVYMDAWYLWRNFLPTQKSAETDPVKYFETLLYKKYDRYSYVLQEERADKIIQGITPTPVFGIRFTFLPIDGKDKMIITEVSKNSNAYKLGIRRASIIDSVSGRLVSKENYQELFASSQGQLIFSFRVRDWEGNYTDRRGGMSRSVFQEDPILADSVIDIAGKKVGYFYYTSFLGNHETAFKETFEKFKSKQVEELIVDLRYNGGGLVSNVKTICGYLIPDAAHEKLMFETSYNSLVDTHFKDVYGQDVNKTYFERYSDNLNLKRVYFLVTGSSASASELLINVLDPYMDVIKIGAKTYGKPVGSFKLSDTDQERKSKHNYVIFPITVSYKNADGKGDYYTGLEPDITVEDNPRYALMATEEPLFKAAVNHIKGGGSASYEQQRLETLHDEIVRTRGAISEYERLPITIDDIHTDIEIKR